MFVLSVKKKQIKRILVLAAVIAAAAVLLIAIYSGDGTEAVPGGAQGICYRAETQQERMQFIEQFGWLAEEDPAEISEVFLPEEFDEVYQNYNEIQKNENGLDLYKYRGKRVKRWSYCITNYPGYENSRDTVRINLLVYSGLVIGGDVCSTQLDGFMHGFAKTS